MMLGDFHFIRPWWLLLVPLAIVVWRMHGKALVAGGGYAGRCAVVSPSATFRVVSRLAEVAASAGSRHVKRLVGSVSEC